MRLGMIGLGRMGMNMARRLLQGDHEVVAFNRTPDKTKQLSSEGAESAFTLEELVNKLETPRIVWIMLPAGKIVDDHIEQLAQEVKSFVETRFFNDDWLYIIEKETRKPAGGSKKTESQKEKAEKNQ